MNKEMTAEKLLKIYKDLKNLGVDIILDGGWGVDALLGQETRAHKDIDFLVEKKNLDKINKYFADNGFKPSGKEEATWFHFLLESPDATADIHIIQINPDGQGIYGPQEKASYSMESLNGQGEVNGVSMRCLSADYRIHCLTQAYGIVTRTGYALKDSDYDDIKKLCDHFDIKMPEEFASHWQKS